MGRAGKLWLRAALAVAVVLAVSLGGLIALNAGVDWSLTPPFLHIG